MEEKIVYFESTSTDNTAAVIRLVKEQGAAKDIKKVVLASTRGGTAMAFSGAFQGTELQLVVVPWQYGFGDRHGMGAQPFPPELVEELREKGHQVHFGTMLFHTEDLYGNNAPRTMANTLRIFGQGIKVCVEIIMMAADGGHLTRGERVIAVAGTGNGADTAVIASAAPSLKFGSLRIHEILCKPL